MLVGTEQLQDGDGAGGEDAIGADDDQDNGEEETGQRFQRRLDGVGHDVTGHQGDDPHQSQQPFDLGFPLSYRGAAQQLHRLCPAQLD